MGIVGKSARALEQRLYSLRYYGLLRTCLIMRNRLNVRYKRDWLKQRFLQRTIHCFKMYLDLNDPGLPHTLAIYVTRDQDQIYIIRIVS